MRRFWTAVLGSIFIAACGGGGEDDAAPVASIAITAANQDAVARATVSAVAAISGAGGGVDVSTGASAATAARAFAARIASGTASARKQRTAANRGRPLAVVSETIACAAGGSFTLSINDVDGDEAPTPGDALTMRFANCHESATESIVGSMTVSLAGFEIDGDGHLSFSGATTISELKVTDGTRSATLNGSLMLSYAETSATRLGLVVGGAGLTASETIGSETQTISYEPEFSYRETGTFDPDTGELLWTSATIEGGFSASAIGGRVQLETPTVILQRAAEAYPYRGALRAVGQGSALRLTAVDATTVRIELDANQDGSYEASRNVDWSDLLPD